MRRPPEYLCYKVGVTSLRLKTVVFVSPSTGKQPERVVKVLVHAERILKRTTCLQAVTDQPTQWRSPVEITMPVWAKKKLHTSVKHKEPERASVKQADSRVLSASKRLKVFEYVCASVISPSATRPQTAHAAPSSLALWTTPEVNRRRPAKRQPKKRSSSTHERKTDERFVDERKAPRIRCNRERDKRNVRRSNA